MMNQKNYKLYKEYEKEVLEINEKLDNLYARKKQLEQELYGDVSGEKNK